MSNLIGQFYFKHTTNGNLLGEFSNNNSFDTSTESADLILNTNTSVIFEGEYNTTWFENKSCSAKLVISLKVDPKGIHFPKGIYLLKWIGDKNNIVFYGEGFIVDGILVGHYRNFNAI